MPLKEIYLDEVVDDELYLTEEFSVLGITCSDEQMVVIDEDGNTSTVNIYGELLTEDQMIIQG